MRHQSAGRHSGSLRLAGVPGELPAAGRPAITRAASRPPRAESRGIMARVALAWPLWSVLAAQAALTLPWLWRTAPFTDEALYLEAGSRIWAHWLHHAVVPDYASWFSGAPVLYPPMGAAMAAAGGLAAARALSLILMLGTTGTVYLAAFRLAGRQTAFLAAALCAVSGLMVHYGAFATYDALALFFLTLGMWAALRARDGGYRWLALCAAALLISNAAKYATLAWDPVVLGIVLLHSWDSGKAEAVRRVSSLTMTLAVLDIGLLEVGGPAYIQGVSATTVFRSIELGADSSASSVLWRAFAVTGVLLVPALLSVVLSAARRAPASLTWLLFLLSLAAIIGPVDQARIHEISSLDKNMGFGLPFAAVAAGYAVSAGVDWASRRLTAGRLAASAGAGALIILVLIAGREQPVQFRGPSTAIAAQLVSAISNNYHRDTYILSDGAARTEQYYLPGIPVSDWVGIFNPTAAQQARVDRQICTGRVSVVILREDNGAYDHVYDDRVRTMLRRSQRYRIAVVATQGHYATQVWRLASSSAAGSSCR